MSKKTNETRVHELTELIEISCKVLQERIPSNISTLFKEHPEKSWGWYVSRGIIKTLAEHIVSVGYAAKMSEQDVRGLVTDFLKDGFKQLK